MKKSPSYETLIQAVSRSGVLVKKDIHGFTVLGVDLTFPHLVITLCTQGSARSKYDLQEMTQQKNGVGIVMPGHILHPMDCTDDYCYTSIAVSPDMIKELTLSAFSHDYEKFHYTPVCQVTDEQMRQLLDVTDLLADVAGQDETVLKRRRQMLLSVLAVGYEFLNVYREELDGQWAGNRYVELFNRFRMLVSLHYRESREVKYYAALLNLTPKHFTRIIRLMTKGVSPGDWIDQYVIAQAKRLIEIHPDLNIQEIAYKLGFGEPTIFHHYYKRVTGTTPLRYKQYIRKKLQEEKQAAKKQAAKK